MADDHEELAPDHFLDRLLGHHEGVPDDPFVLNVMHRVQREQRRRKAILYVFGLLGALFGLLGAFLLAEPIERLFTGLPVTGLMQTALLAGAGAAFYAWFMNDDFGLST